MDFNSVIIQIIISLGAIIVQYISVVVPVKKENKALNKKLNKYTSDILDSIMVNYDVEESKLISSLDSMKNEFTCFKNMGHDNEQLNLREFNVAWETYENEIKKLEEKLFSLPFDKLKAIEEYNKRI